MSVFELSNQRTQLRSEYAERAHRAVVICNKNSEVSGHKRNSIKRCRILQLFLLQFFLVLTPLFAYIWYALHYECSHLNVWQHFIFLEEFRMELLMSSSKHHQKCIKCVIKQNYIYYWHIFIKSIKENFFHQTSKKWTLFRDLSRKKAIDDFAQA